MTIKKELLKLRLVSNCACLFTIRSQLEQVTDHITTYSDNQNSQNSSSRNDRHKKFELKERSILSEDISNLSFYKHWITSYLTLLIIDTFVNIA